jgi:glutathione S-transferase
MMIFPLEAAFARLPGMDRYPNIERYVRAIHDRPAYRRALEKGGDYSFAPLR